MSNHDQFSLNVTTGIGCSSLLFQRLKNHVIALATGNPALGSVQIAAQAALQQAWCLLLPTAKERTSALATLLHRDGEYGTSMIISNSFVDIKFKLSSSLNIIALISIEGGRFMADLLVTSLMADGGLEIALEQSILGNSFILIFPTSK